MKNIDSVVEKPAKQSGGLRSNALSMPMILALGLGYMSLAPVIYFNFGLISVSAGAQVAPLIFLIVTVAVLPTAMSFAELTKRRPTAGSTSIWIEESLGRRAGAWTGWLQSTQYIAGCAIYPAYFSVFFNPFLQFFGIEASYMTSALASVGICAIVAYLMQHSIGLSAKHILWLMGTEAIFVLGLAVYIAVVEFGSGNVAAPMAPFTLDDTAGSSAVVLAVVFAILSIAGVDSIAPLGEEAQDPKRTIPKATLIVTIVAGVFWAITSYGYSLAVSTEELNGYVEQGLVTPIFPIAEKYLGVLSILVPLTGFTAVLAGFGATAICASRLLFNQARLGFAPKWLAVTHPRYGSPWNASKPILIFSVVAPLVAGLILGSNASNAAAWWGGFFVFFALLTYLLVNIANVVWTLKYARSEFSVLRNGILPGLGSAIIAFMLYQFFVVYLAGDFATGQSIVYFSVAWTIIGGIWAVRVSRRKRVASVEVAPATERTEA